MTNMIDEIGSEQSINCYPGTDVLKNKRDIRDLEELESEEKILTAYKLAILNSGDYSGIQQTWDDKHYLSIHKFLFEELYEFAGKTRNENISKSILFCDYRFINKELKDWLEILDYNINKIVNRKLLIKSLGRSFIELNKIHPFREGNGRTLREFLREYVERVDKVNNLNYELNYKLVTDALRDKYLYASIHSDVEQMEKVFDSLIIEKEYEDEKGTHK